MELLLYRRSRQQWTQLLREIYRKTEELRARNQGGRIRSGRHDDIHKRILLRWDRTGRVFLGGEHLNAHATGIHRPVSGNGEDQVGRKFFSLPESQYSRLVIRSPRYIVPSFRIPHFVASLLTFRLPPREEKRRKKKEKKNGGVAYAVRVMDARWKRRRGRERRKRGAGMAVGRKRHNRKGWNETQRLLLCASMMGWPKRGMERENGRTGERDCGGAVNKTGIIQRSRSDFVRASTLLRFDSPLSLSLSSVVKFDGRRTRRKQMV